MNRELCFYIENKDIYLEQVLVDYMDIPIFFLCRGEKQYYIALCTDIDELSYIVVKLSLPDVYHLLHGKIPMRDVILKQSEYWDILSGDEINSDIVTKKSMDALETSLLPEEKASFKVLTKQMQLFVQKFDSEFFAAECFSVSDKKVEIKVEKTVSSQVLLYNEKMESIKTTEIVFRNIGQSKQKETEDLFELSDLSVNNIADAA